MPRPCRVLIVTSVPDERDSTQRLKVLIAELESRPGVVVEVWYLRAYHREHIWRRGRVIDRLRTFPPARLLDLVGLRIVGDRIRGLLLRRWWHQAAPDAVVLDDGLGGRVLPRRLDDLAVVLRWNEEPPEYAWMESPWEGPVALHLPFSPACLPEGATGPVLRTPVLWTLTDPDPKLVRPEVVPEDAPAIVGWGGDGWVDGADLFVRILWALGHHQGVAAHGIWYYAGGSREHAARLDAEAERCGVGDRFHVIEDPGPGRRWLGDVVVLPFRGSITPDEMHGTLLRGREIVTFEPCALAEPGVAVVAPLDIDGAAEAAAAALARGTNSVADQIGLQRWADRFLDHVAPGGR